MITTLGVGTLMVRPAKSRPEGSSGSKLEDGVIGGNSPIKSYAVILRYGYSGKSPFRGGRVKKVLDGR
jgi:hypothetical protein